jgi:hypothetical protein
VNPSELAMALLKWEEKKRELVALEDEIKAAVLTLGKTQNVGNIRASFSKGRRTFDYRGAVKLARLGASRLETEDEQISRGNEISEAIMSNTQTIIKVGWRDVCKDLSLTPEVLSQSDPSVTIKLL